MTLKKRMIFGLVVLSALKGLYAQEIIQLYSGYIPNAIEDENYQEEAEVNEGKLIRSFKVSEPTLTVFRPQKSNGTAVIICPGGGYRHLAMDKEGFKPAKWLNELGITAFVLKYRLPNDRIMKDKSLGPLQDVQEAFRYVRSHLDDYNIEGDKIGVMGFSAGGHLAATASNIHEIVLNDEDKVNLKPDFSILVYPVISMEEGVTHQGSKTSLLGENPSREHVEKFSIENQIDAQTPRFFLVHASDDGAVPVENSLRYYEKALGYGVNAEFHVYNEGGHGFGLKGRGSSAGWTEVLKNWLNYQGLIQ
ncbi:alpha/beta hydrolase [Mangrovimonas sp. YM274]|uniref:alpha/beta hydrolase n=1 Tax=Mangrovimonas sp. YM274 TaxID=3070660 RepID=UPI0027DCF4A8|nr:alpha/beta hydrolase [Mangrovimonas sp. YM274]WMI69086.1 alpha/beta hydrolase [Mangrovimonas sp. YM274]